MSAGLANSTLERVTALVAQQLDLDPADVLQETSLEDMGGDSLDQVELVLNVEDEFGIEFTDEESEQLHTVAQFVAGVEKALARRN